MTEPLSGHENAREASPSLAANRDEASGPEPSRDRAGADERERLGRLVHDTRLACEADQAAAEGRTRFHLGTWEERSDGQRELDMRIGEAVRDQVLNTGPARGEIVREAWVYWALEQPDVAEHPNWVKSWAELDDRDREADDRIYAAVAAAERERIRRLAVEHHARIGESCDLHGTVHYRRDFAGLLGGEGEGRPRVAVDLNVRVRKHETYSGFEDVAGTDPASLRFGDRVLASEAEDRICSPAIVTGVDPERRLVYLVPDWHGWRDDPAAGGQPAPEEPPQGETP